MSEIVCPGCGLHLMVSVSKVVDSTPQITGNVVNGAPQGVSVDSGSVVGERLMKIHWEPRKGPAGEFEIAEAKTNVDNEEFKALKAALMAENNIRTHEGVFYWLFPNGDAVGRKPEAEVNGRK